jgi:uncharacterized membrane protein
MRLSPYFAGAIRFQSAPTKTPDAPAPTTEPAPAVDPAPAPKAPSPIQPATAPSRQPAPPVDPDKDHKVCFF